jgi:hypothetical protein
MLRVSSNCLLANTPIYQAVVLKELVCTYLPIVHIVIAHPTCTVSSDVNLMYQFANIKVCLPRYHPASCLARLLHGHSHYMHQLFRS